MSTHITVTEAATFANEVEGLAHTTSAAGDALVATVAGEGVHLMHASDSRLLAIWETSEHVSFVLPATPVPFVERVSGEEGASAGATAFAAVVSGDIASFSRVVPAPLDGADAGSVGAGGSKKGRSRRRRKGKGRTGDADGSTSGEALVVWHPQVTSLFEEALCVRLPVLSEGDALLSMHADGSHAEPDTAAVILCTVSGRLLRVSWRASALEDPTMVELVPGDASHAPLVFATSAGGRTLLVSAAGDVCVVRGGQGRAAESWTSCSEAPVLAASSDGASLVLVCADGVLRACDVVWTSHEVSATHEVPLEAGTDLAGVRVCLLSADFVAVMLGDYLSVWDLVHGICLGESAASTLALSSAAAASASATPIVVLPATPTHPRFTFTTMVGLTLMHCQIPLPARTSLALAVRTTQLGRAAQAHPPLVSEHHAATVRAAVVDLDGMLASRAPAEEWAATFEVAEHKERVVLEALAAAASAADVHALWDAYLEAHDTVQASQLYLVSLVNTALRLHAWDTVAEVMASRSLSAASLPTLLPTAVRHRQWALVLRAVISMRDISERQIVWLLTYLLSMDEQTEEHLNAWLRTTNLAPLAAASELDRDDDEDEPATPVRIAFGSDTPVETMLGAMMALPVTNTLMTQHLRLLTAPGVEQMLVLCRRWVKRFARRSTHYFTENTLPRAVPTLPQILAWTSMLVDAHFADMVLVPRLRRVLASMRDTIDAHIDLAADMADMAGYIALFTSKTRVQLPITSVPEYSIERLAL